jgi:hypothetical protein
MKRGGIYYCSAAIMHTQEHVVDMLSSSLSSDGVLSKSLAWPEIYKTKKVCGTQR